LGEQLDRLQHVVQDDRLVDVELEVALRASEGHGVVVAEHLHVHLRQRLALGRINLPRIPTRAPPPLATPRRPTPPTPPRAAAAAARCRRRLYVHFCRRFPFGGILRWGVARRSCVPL